MSFLSFNAIAPEALEQDIAARLARRLEEAPCYNADEISKVSSLSTRLFPPGIKLDDALGEDFRLLVRFSTAELRAPSQITSHRPLIGPVIVAVKRLFWPLVRALLKDTFVQIEEYHSRMLQLCAMLIVKNSVLQDELNDIRTGSFQS
jgi:hypothetical protein